MRMIPYSDAVITMDKRHRYTTPDGPMDSVTTILGTIDKSGALLGWQKKTIRDAAISRLDVFANEGETMPVQTAKDVVIQAVSAADDARDKAADRGTRIHDAMENWFKMPGWEKSKKITDADHKYCIALDVDIQRGVRGLMRWARSVELAPLHTEMKVYSRKRKYAGTLDLVCEGRFRYQRKTKTALLDFKSGTVIRDIHCAQVAAYERAYCEMHGLYTLFDVIGVVQVDPETGETFFYNFTHFRLKGWKLFQAAQAVRKLVKDKVVTDDKYPELNRPPVAKKKPKTTEDEKEG